MSKLTPEEVGAKLLELDTQDSIYIPKAWLRVIANTPGGSGGIEMVSVLAKMVNPFWVKDAKGKPVGIKPAWEDFVFVITPDLLETWASFLRLSDKTLKRMLDQLTGGGFLQRLPNFSGEEVEAILKLSKTPQRVPTYLSYQCQWCTCFTGYLHNHHYPIPKSKGGELTVAICPNCHCEFHLLVGLRRYKLTHKVWTVAAQYEEQEIEG